MTSLCLLILGDQRCFQAGVLWAQRQCVHKRKYFHKIKMSRRRDHDEKDEEKIRKLQENSHKVELKTRNKETNQNPKKRQENRRERFKFLILSSPSSPLIQIPFPRCSSVCAVWPNFRSASTYSSPGVEIMAGRGNKEKRKFLLSYEECKIR